MDQHRHSSLASKLDPIGTTDLGQAVSLNNICKDAKHCLFRFRFRAGIMQPARSSNVLQAYLAKAPRTRVIHNLLKGGDIQGPLLDRGGARLSFVAHLLTWIKPFMSPLHSWCAVLAQGTACLGKYCPHIWDLLCCLSLVPLVRLIGRGCTGSC